MNGDPSHLIPLLEKMPWDAVNIGNHELYRDDVFDYMNRPGGFVDWWGTRLVSSNVFKSDSKEPVGNLYRVLNGRNGSLLVFGFLYNMTDHCDHVSVGAVQTVIQEDWFSSALQKESFDAIVVMAHMDAVHDLVTVILSKIRSIVGSDVPVQFIAGHTHRRFVSMLDTASNSFEAGRFLDTVGFVSFPSKNSLQSSPLNETASLFRYRFINASVDELEKSLDVETLLTEDGKELSRFIFKTQEELGLHELIGCLQGSYYVDGRSLYDSDSLWKFFNEKVVPSQFDDNVVLFMGQEFWRYDLLGGDMRLDDIIAVSPFNESFVAWDNVPSEVIASLNRTMNQGNSTSLPHLPLYVLSPVEPFNFARQFYTLVTNRFEESKIQKELSATYSVDLKPFLLSNRTTTGVWTDYFRGNQAGCRPFAAQSKDNDNTNQAPSIPLPGGILVATDYLGFGIAILAILVVVTLGTVHIRQRGILWRRQVQLQEYETMEAIRERSEEEGEFI